MPRKRTSTKGRIVKAAWTLFSKKGYDSTTIEDIISLSKTSKGTFYHYFKGKESLLNTLSDLFDDKYEELLQALDPDMSATEKLLFLNHQVFDMIETSIDISILAYLYSSQITTKDTRSLSDTNRLYFRCCTQIIQEGIQSGEFTTKNTAAELMDVYAMFERSALYDWALKDGTESLTEKSDRLLPHVLKIFKEGY